MCADSYSVSVPPRVTAVARKKNRSFCQKCWWQVIPKHPDIHNPRRWSGLTIPLSRHSVRIYPETSLHATCQGTFGHSRLSSLSHCGLILAYKSGKSVRELISNLKKKKKKTQTGNNLSKILPKSLQILVCEEIAINLLKIFQRYSTERTSCDLT